MPGTLKRIFDRDLWRTILLLIISAFVFYAFCKAVFDNPALDPERVGRTIEAQP